MSRQITIQEGGQPKSLTVDKLQTALVGGGSMLWVPEDETTTTTKHITANGTYQAASDDAYGYSEVTVNVSGGNGSADSHGVPTISGGTLPGGIGSSVVGKDPETGNDVAAGVDEDGNLVMTPVPSGIWVRTPPTKTEYAVGETIDYTGIVVSPIKRDQSTFVDDKYPAGKIPFEELIFPVETAPDPGGGSDDYTDGQGVNARKFSYVYRGEQSSEEMWVSDAAAFRRGDYDYNPGDNNGEATVFLTRYSGKIYARKLSGAGTKLFFYYWKNDHWIRRITSSHDMSTEYWWQYGWELSDVTEWYIPESTVDPTENNPGPDDMHSTAVTIPVQWKSPYTGETLEDSFEITVAGTDPDDGGGDDGGGGTTVDDDGFSGGGGGF